MLGFCLPFNSQIAKGARIQKNGKINPKNADKSCFVEKFSLRRLPASL